jgi:uncharacterized membrane protein YhaH (DUF805 family)
MNEFGLLAGLRGFVRPLDFEGRSSRTELVAMAVAYLAIAIVVQSVGIPITKSLHGDLSLRQWPIFIALYPWPAMFVRRAHDAGQGAWIVLVALLTKSLPLLVLWPGQEEVNKFGPNPRLLDFPLGTTQETSG